MLGSPLPALELGVAQARLVQKGRPGVHGISAGAGSGQRHRAIARRQMHAIQDRAFPKTSAGDRAREAELVDEIRGRTTTASIIETSICCFTGLSLLEKCCHAGDDGIAGGDGLPSAPRLSPWVADRSGQVMYKNPPWPERSSRCSGSLGRDPSVQRGNGGHNQTGIYLLECLSAHPNHQGSQARSSRS